MCRGGAQECTNLGGAISAYVGGGGGVHVRGREGRGARGEQPLVCAEGGGG